MQSKASDAYQMISGGGYYTGKNEAGEKVTMRGNLASHAQYNGMATQVKDWASASNATLQRAAKNGGLDKTMAKQILNSQDHAVQSGILSDKDKRATLEAIARGEYEPVGNSANETSRPAPSEPSADVDIYHNNSSNARLDRISDAAHDNPFMDNE